MYQLPNPGFEIWDGSGTDDEPTYWNGFPSADCDLVIGCSSATATRHSKSTDIRPGTSGSYSLKLFATEINILGNTIIANGNITTGQIRIGSTSASSSQNYNISLTSNSAFSQPLNAKPDSIRFWAKFVCPSSTQQARINAIIHDNYNYRDTDLSDPNAPAHIVAKATYNFTRGSQNWVNYTIPFDYAYPASTAHYILITFTTNKVPGEGSSSDVLFVDDIEFIYNPRLSNLLVNGISVPNFHPDTTDYYLSVPCSSVQNISANAASPNANVLITQPSFINPEGIALVTAGNVSREYTIHFSYENVTDISAHACYGDTYNDTWFNLPAQLNTGTFIHQTSTFTSPECDSIVRLTLTVHPEFHPDTIYAQICENGTYNFYGLPLTEEGIYDTIIPTQFGCDSIVILHLSVGDFYLFTIIDSICEGETYEQHGFNLSTSGTDTLFYQAVDGCDSLMVLNLTVHPRYSTTIYDTITAGNAYTENGFSIPPINDAGTFNFELNLQSHSSCDSTTYLVLCVMPEEEEPMDEDPEFDITVYPNPAHAELTIDIITSSSAIFFYELYDQYGRICKFGEIENNNVTIFIAELSVGIYILKVRSMSGNFLTAKIITY